MKIFYAVKRRDACYAIRVLTPLPHLQALGHEIKEELLELQHPCGQCPDRRIHEFNYTETGLFHCAGCGRAIPQFPRTTIEKWREDLFAGIDWADLVVFQ